MLVLKQNQTIIGPVAEGAPFRLPNGDMVSVAYSGWTGAGGFSVVDVAQEPTSVTSADVDAERDRRMRGIFLFNGRHYDCDPTSLQRITGAAALAGFFLAGGGSPTDVYWHGGTEPFAWIAHDNQIEVMDAQTVFAFGRAAAENETLHIFAARALKNMTPIPQNFADNAFWP